MEESDGAWVVKDMWVLTTLLLWAAISVPLALLAGRVLRWSRAPTVAEEAEEYLRTRAPRPSRLAWSWAFALVAGLTVGVVVVGDEAVSQLPAARLAANRGLERLMGITTTTTTARVRDDVATTPASDAGEAERPTARKVGGREHDGSRGDDAARSDGDGEPQEVVATTEDDEASGSDDDASTLGDDDEASLDGDDSSGSDVDDDPDEVYEERRRREVREDRAARDRPPESSRTTGPPTTTTTEPPTTTTTEPHPDPGTTTTTEPGPEPGTTSTVAAPDDHTDDDE